MSQSGDHAGTLDTANASITEYIASHDNSHDGKDDQAGPLLQKASTEEGSIFYLAYGSNLAASTFLGWRGIRPLSMRNVVVPSLKLLFDLPGVPYAEPCFANSGTRDPENDPPTEDESPRLPPHLDSEKPIDPDDYHKERWHKGLVGVVYELTHEDYARVIATEGGGSGYKDVIVDAYPLREKDTVIPIHPDTMPFKVHTLFAPSAHESGRYSRKSQAYAQPSLRYIELLRTGAKEHNLPHEYREFLAQIRPYTITTRRQGFGKVIILALWGPFVALVRVLTGAFKNKDGKIPPWLGKLLWLGLQSIWIFYDSMLHPFFGDGERTIGQGEDLH